MGWPISSTRAMTSQAFAVSPVSFGELGLRPAHSLDPAASQSSSMQGKGLLRCGAQDGETYQYLGRSSWCPSPERCLGSQPQRHSGQPWRSPEVNTHPGPCRDLHPLGPPPPGSLLQGTRQGHMGPVIGPHSSSGCWRACGGEAAADSAEAEGTRWHNVSTGAAATAAEGASGTSPSASAGVSGRLGTPSAASQPPSRTGRCAGGLAPVPAAHVGASTCSCHHGHAAPPCEHAVHSSGCSSMAGHRGEQLPRSSSKDTKRSCCRVSGPAGPRPTTHSSVGLCGTPCGKAARPRAAVPLPRFLSALLLLLLAQHPGRVLAGEQTGSDFPFEGCVAKQRNSRYYATLYSYRENVHANTSTFCLQVNLLPVADCTPGRWRCCDTPINKLKVFPAPNCRGSVASGIVNGNSVMSYYWEVHQGYDIVKVTPLQQWLSSPERAEGAIICLNLQPPCWRLPDFAFQGSLLEYSLYDKKAYNYECCPTGTVVVPQTSLEPSFPGMPPPYTTPPPSPPPRRSPPPSPPRSRPPPPKNRKSPPPPPPSPAIPDLPPSPPPPRPPPPRSPFLVRRPPPPSPPSPLPLPRKRSPPPPPSDTSLSPPPPPSPPPPLFPDGCTVTVTVSRSAANQAFTQKSCSLYGMLVLLPVYGVVAEPPEVSYNCDIVSSSYMVMTIALATRSDTAALFRTYGEALQRQNAVAVLSLTDCSRDFALLTTACPGSSPVVRLRAFGAAAAPVRHAAAPSAPAAAASLPASLPSSSPPLPSAALASSSAALPAALPTAAPGSPRILVRGSSAYLLFPAPSDFFSAEATCVALGGHLAAVDSGDEFLFLQGELLAALPPGGSSNTWFGLYITEEKSPVIPGYNTDGSRISFIPASFQYDRTRSAVRYYMMACATSTAVCAWVYSPGGAADVQPSFLCEFANHQENMIM